MVDKLKNMDKRVPKGSVKFKMPLSEEQKEHKSKILHNTINVITGVAGSSKSFLACNIALDMFFNREVDRISLCRPAVSTEELGYLPGTMEEKYFQWCLPLIDNMYKMYDKVKVDKMIKEGDIIFRPLQFIAGITFDREVAILDEAQNATYEQTIRFLTRIGKNAKVIITGDVGQIDLKGKSHSGLSRLIDVEDKIKGMYVARMEGNYRNDIVRDVLEFYK
jgi:phosphate starvation-inducible PhoH-like protein